MLKICGCRTSSALSRIPGRETIFRDIPGKTGILGRYANVRFFSTVLTLIVGMNTEWVETAKLSHIIRGGPTCACARFTSSSASVI